VVSPQLVVDGELKLVVVFGCQEPGERRLVEANGAVMGRRGEHLRELDRDADFR